MQRNRGPRLLPIFITLVVIIIFVVAIISIGRALFGGGSSSDAPVADNGQTQLLNTDEGQSVRLTIRGPIVADETFRSYTIDVSPLRRSMDVYQGYLDRLDKYKTYDNNEPAYAEFVNALDKAEMMKGEQATGEAADLLGICATGYVYQYDVRSNDRVIKTLWTSTCKGSKGSLDANVTQLNNLFQKQIPAFKDLTPFSNNSVPSSF